LCFFILAPDGARLWARWRAEKPPFIPEEKLSKKGIVFVAAAGNEGPTAAPSYPAAYPQVIAATAVTKDLRNYRYANCGDHIDVAAPGVNIWTAMPGGRAACHSGTSFAAPHVTAILAVEPPGRLKQDKADLLDGLPVIDLGRQGAILSMGGVCSWLPPNVRRLG
jgi:subtilisin family serine protease